MGGVSIYRSWANKRKGVVIFIWDRNGKEKKKWDSDAANSDMDFKIFKIFLNPHVEKQVTINQLSVDVWLHVDGCAPKLEDTELTGGVEN